MELLWALHRTSLLPVLPNIIGNSVKCTKIAIKNQLTDIWASFYSAKLLLKSIVNLQLLISWKKGGKDLNNKYTEGVAVAIKSGGDPAIPLPLFMLIET